MPCRLGFILWSIVSLLTIRTAVAAEPEPKSPERIVNSLGMTFVRLEAGTFRMGSPFDEPARSSDESLHEITLSRPFAIGTHETTQAEYTRVMGTNPSGFTPARRDDLGDTGRFPVEQVSWDDANEFCRKLSADPEEIQANRTYRLPTEAEWEYACRAGGAVTPFHFDQSLGSTDANIHGKYPYGAAAVGPSLQRTAAVGSYKPSRLGLYDLHGNVWEWCADKYNRDYYLNGPKTDPTGPRGGEQRVLRGGSWLNDATRCRTAYRGKYPPDVRVNNVGFRVVLEIPVKDVNEAPK